MTTIEDLSANPVAWGWVSPEDFVKDIKDGKYKSSNTFLFTHLSGEALKEQEAKFRKESKLIEIERNNELSTKIDEVVGSNANWGRITQSEELGGTSLEELGITDIKTPLSKYRKSIFSDRETQFFFNELCLDKGELTEPIAEEIDEIQGNIVDAWFCKGCSKQFATKSSLKRHHDRKKSCKDICEAKPEEIVKTLEVPEKPYVVEWVEESLSKAISGDSEKPYCKHCDVEFANKSNLHKHLSKSVACDKLAKQAFLEGISKV